MKMYNAVIKGVGSYLPEKVLTNADLEKMVETNDEWITKRTGIKERHIAREDEFTSDLAVNAAREAIADAGMKSEDIDLILVSTVTPDMYTPSVACIVQNKIGAVNAAAIDMNTACAGFVSALGTANAFIKIGQYKNVLVIGADALSKITDYDDRSTCILFGDGAGAMVVSASEEETGILSSVIGADGSGKDKIYCDGLSDPKWCDEERQTVKKPHTLWMNGGEVLKFAVRIMASATFEVLEKAGLKVDDVDLIVPHQANIRIVDGAKKRIGISDEKIFTNLHKVGNMSGASIPVAFAEAYKKGLVKKGDKIVLVGFGGGLTWAAIALEWNK